MDFLELYYADVYKTGHKFMLPEGTELAYSNKTPRSGKRSNCPNDGYIISGGEQIMVRKMSEDWDKNFFKRPIEEIEEFGNDMTIMLGLKEKFDVSHFRALHKLGYLPLKIKSLKEGSRVPYGVPTFTIVNTKPMDGVVYDFLVNYLETIMSSESWHTPTSATLVFSLKLLGKKWITKTDPENAWFLDYAFHDFSARGLSGKSAWVNSGLGFAFGSRGSDTLTCIPASRKYYDEPKGEVCINSVIASEHAIMCTLTGFFLIKKDGSWDKIGDLEVETFRYLLRRFPTGILSLVSDTWDLWRVILDYCAVLKEEILARDGKLVIRPDSGNPADIITGTVKNVFKSMDDARAFFERNVGNDLKFIVNGEYFELIPHSGNDFRYAPITIPHISERGVVEALYLLFGGDMPLTGYKRLNPKIGCIYGDSITYERSQNIYERLAQKGFAATNIVFGIGSYSLQGVTRDTHGWAHKTTYVEIAGQGVNIFKDPITDSGMKKSARGLLQVYLDENGEFRLKDQCTWEEEAQGELQLIFEDGKFHNQTTLKEIRKRFDANLEKVFAKQMEAVAA